MTFKLHMIIKTKMDSIYASYKVAHTAMLDMLLKADSNTRYIFMATFQQIFKNHHVFDVHACIF